MEIDTLKKRFKSLVFKIISRKGIIMILNTILLLNGFIDQQIWFYLTVAIVTNITGEKLVEKLS